MSARTSEPPQRAPTVPPPSTSTSLSAPEKREDVTSEAIQIDESLLRRQATIEDDRETIEPGDSVLLIVEDDPHFARILLDLAHEKGFKGVVATQAESAFGMVRRYRPAAVTLDIQLPGTHGLTLLDRLKHDPGTRHIPVHILSVADRLPRNRRKGVVRQLKKPVTRESVEKVIDEIIAFAKRPVRQLLVIEDDDAQRKSIAALLAGDDVALTQVASAQAALTALSTGRFDCAVLDLGLPDMNGFELLTQIRDDHQLSDLPVIVYTARDLAPEDASRLHKLAEAVIVKDVNSLNRLLDETTLYLHREEAGMPEVQRDALQQLHQPEASLAGRQVLIVDDDIRNIFAVTSLLERHQMKVIYAESGEEGIEKLQGTPGIDAVLMDVMMPGMDGYETTRAIRKLPRFKNLPIIAVTAKAMKGDREKCIEAGASDYITKPVNVEQLLSLLRVWINK